jgi:hypothetical protein
MELSLSTITLLIWRRVRGGFLNQSAVSLATFIYWFDIYMQVLLVGRWGRFPSEEFPRPNYRGPLKFGIISLLTL